MGRLNDKEAIASKWPIRGISAYATAELGHAGIGVNTLFPGMIRAPMLDCNSSEVLAHFEAMPPIGRPEEIAQLVAFLASDASSHATNAEIVR
jgi:3alpha(or 20beta)-hydroxysteroid dehydrogenase